VTCDPTAVLDENCEGVCPLPTVPCGDGQCAHCGAICQVDQETCECICPCEDEQDCVTGQVCCEGTCRASCEDEDSCITGTLDACPDDFECCALPGSPPGGDGICIPVGTQCARQGCQPAGTACLYDSECCVGTCGEDGFCFCEDPAKPALNCPCDPSVADVCGDDYVCCEADDDGVCTPTSVGCDDGGGGATQTPVPSLPSTGIGSAPDGSNGGWLAPAALAGAGAALVASRLIRRTTEAEPETTEG
jgi:hypothetical protein